MDTHTISRKWAWRAQRQACEGGIGRVIFIVREEVTHFLMSLSLPSLQSYLMLSFRSFPNASHSHTSVSCACYSFTLSPSLLFEDTAIYMQQVSDRLHGTTYRSLYILRAQAVGRQCVELNTERYHPPKN